MFHRPSWNSVEYMLLSAYSLARCTICRPSAVSVVPIAFVRSLCGKASCITPATLSLARTTVPHTSRCPVCFGYASGCCPACTNTGCCSACRQSRAQAYSLPCGCVYAHFQLVPLFAVRHIADAGKKHLLHNQSLLAQVFNAKTLPGNAPKISSIVPPACTLGRCRPRLFLVDVPHGGSGPCAESAWPNTPSDRAHQSPVSMPCSRTNAVNSSSIGPANVSATSCATSFSLRPFASARKNGQRLPDCTGQAFAGRVFIRLVPTVPIQGSVRLCSARHSQHR